jgi:hypothetical protein
MWAAWVVAAIAWAGAAFMLRFLIALLRESAPSVWYWVVPVRRDPRLENDYYAKEESSSVLIAFDVYPVSDRLGFRTVHSDRGYVFREPRLQFDRGNRTAGNAG